jgi:hypothetical protein
MRTPRSMPGYQRHISKPVEPGDLASGGVASIQGTAVLCSTTLICHSRCNVASGFTRVALSAGTAHDAMATSKTNSVIAENVRGSQGLTPNNICSSNRVAPSAPATPTANPARVSFKTRPTTPFLCFSLCLQCKHAFYLNQDAEDKSGRTPILRESVGRRT